MTSEVEKTIIAIDYGEARVGCAIAVSPDLVPKPLVTLDGKTNLYNQVEELINQHHPTQFVIGLPRNLEGEDTEQTAKARVFAGELQQRFDIPVDFQDETLSTEEALNRLGDMKLNKKKALLDQMAAQVILEDYLA